MQLNSIRALRRRHFVMAFLATFLGGLGLAWWGWVFHQPSFLLLLFGFVFARRSQIGLFILVGVCGLNLGLWRGESTMIQLSQYQPLYGQKMIVTGRVSDDTSRTDKGQTEFHLSNITIEGEAFTGRIRVRSLQAIGVQRGDLVQVEGKLHEGFGNRQGSMSYAQVDVLGRSSNPVESIRRQYFAGVYSTLTDPESSLGLGFLVGLRALLPDDLQDQLAITGLSHIVAVSGYNLTVLVRLTRRGFAKRSRYQSLIISFVLIGAFLLVTGAAPSIVRAAVVSCIALVAWYFGRPIKPMMLLLLGAAITAGVNPLYLWLDLGWWLSFLAFFGILIIAPQITTRIYKEKPKFIGATLIETTAAQLMALPLIMWVFGDVSLISIVANALILPLVPLAMLFTFIAGTAGTLLPHAAGWLAWPAQYILSFMTDLIAIMSQLPYALVSVDISRMTMLIIYALILAIVSIVIKRNKHAAPTYNLIE